MRGNGDVTFSSLLVSRSRICSSRRRCVERPTHDVDHQTLSELHHIVERRVRHLGFDHPELRQMAARLRLLGAEGRPEPVHPAERHRVRLVVQLTALREIRRGVFEVLDRKERGRAFARRRREDRRVREDEPATVEEVAHRVDHLVPHAEDCLLPR